MLIRHRLPITVPATLLAALLLGACSSQVPLLIRQGPLDSPAPALVSDRVGDYAGRAVRWGGLLIATDNRAEVTRLTILARPLANDGEPGSGDTSLGRFIALVPGFLDPQVYAPDRLVTVTGTVHGSETGRVGDHAYRYPVVEAQAWYLWPAPDPVPYGYPYYYDRWYDPWYGPWWYGHWYDPWYYRHPYLHRHPYRRVHDHPEPGPEKVRPGTGRETGPGHAGPVPREHRHPGQRTPRERPGAGHGGDLPREAPAVPPPAPTAPAPVAEPPGRDRGILRFFRRRSAD